MSRATPIGSHGMRYQVQLRYRGGMVGMEPLFVDAEMIERAAHELASQEFHNPSWCQPGIGRYRDEELYRRRARLILEAALKDERA